LTSSAATDASRRTRWLPSVVAGLFVLMLAIDIAVVIYFGSYHDLIEDDAVEAAFTPRAAAAGGDGESGLVIRSDSPLVAADGQLVAETTLEGFAVYQPGELTLRFRSRNAGGYVVLPYEFGSQNPKANCATSLSRVPSAHGVDTINRRVLHARRGVRGVYRQYLADHSGWFELTLELNREATREGFRIGRPEIEFD
jgi:hypothetical protein